MLCKKLTIYLKLLRDYHSVVFGGWVEDVMGFPIPKEFFFLNMPLDCNIPHNWRIYMISY